VPKKVRLETFFHTSQYMPFLVYELLGGMAGEAMRRGPPTPGCVLETAFHELILFHDQQFLGHHER